MPPRRLARSLVVLLAGWSCRPAAAAEPVGDPHYDDRALLGRMEETRRRILFQQKIARAQKDIIKLNCVNDKLLQVKGHLAVADNALGQLDGALVAGDDQAMAHQRVRLRILHDKVVVLGTEAENCIGEDLSYVGQATCPGQTWSWVCDQIWICEHDDHAREEGAASPPSRPPAGPSTVPTSIRLRHRGAAGWEPIRMVATLDGAELYFTRNEPVRPPEVILLLEGWLAPGEHEVRVTIEWRGTGAGLFSYMSEYRHTTSATYRFHLAPAASFPLDIMAGPANDFDIRFTAGDSVGGGRRVWLKSYETAPCERGRADGEPSWVVTSQLAPPLPRLAFPAF